MHDIAVGLENRSTTSIKSTVERLVIPDTKGWFDSDMWFNLDCPIKEKIIGLDLIGISVIGGSAIGDPPIYRAIEINDIQLWYSADPMDL